MVRWQRWLQVGTAATLVAAAAGFLIATWGNGLRKAQQVESLPAGSTQARPEPPASEADRVQARKTSRALDDAERSYLTAIQELEPAYLDQRARLDPDEARKVDRQLRSLREQLESERALARDDVWARRHVLRTYSAYMHTMQTVVVAQSTVGMVDSGPEDMK